MILFGRKDKYIATKDMPNEVCPECGKRGGIVSIFQIYFHILRLPVAPVSRKVASQCLHCRDVKIEKDFSESQKAAGAELRAKNKTPLWTMIGAGITLVFIVVKLVLRFI